MIAVTLAAQLLLMIGIGLFMRKTGIVGAAFAKDLSSFVLKILIPLMIFNSVKNGPEFSLSMFASCGLALAAGAVTMLIGMSVGQALYVAGKRTGRARIFRYAASFPNFSFMGLPIMEGLFGARGTFYYVFFMIPVRICYYTMSEHLMTPEDRQKKKRTGAQTARGILLNPALDAVFLGMVFWITGWQVPAVLDYAVRTCGSMCSPMGLILGGVMLGGYEFRKLLDPEYLKAPAVRLVVMPVILLVISRLFHLLGVEKMICDMMIVFSALPIAGLLPAFAMQYDPDPENQLFAVGACVISVLFSAVTVPLWYLLVQAI